MTGLPVFFYATMRLGAKLLADTLLRIRDFEKYGVYAGFSGRHGGLSKDAFSSLNIGLHVGDENQVVLHNRQVIAHDLGISDMQVTYAEQIHGTDVAVIDELHVGRGHASLQSAVQGVDAMVTKVNHAALAIVAADCVPLLFADLRHPVIGAAHAGWRGATGGIVAKTVETMLACGASLSSLYVAMGPAIRGCCYEVDEPVISQYKAAYHRIGKKPQWQPSTKHSHRVMIDLPTLLNDQLISLGITQNRILDTAICTHCMDGYYSYRKENGTTGRHGGFIALRR